MIQFIFEKSELLFTSVTSVTRLDLLNIIIIKYHMPFIQTNDNYKPELLEEYNTFRLMHGYDMKLKVWKFIGYTCTKCDRTVKNPNIVPKHFQNCKAGPPTIYKQEPDPEQIRNVRGEVWVPYEINQKKPLINTE